MAHTLPWNGSSPHEMWSYGLCIVMGLKSVRDVCMCHVWVTFEGCFEGTVVWTCDCVGRWQPFTVLDSVSLMYVLTYWNLLHNAT